jgi:hypothetical protein
MEIHLATSQLYPGSDMYWFRKACDGEDICGNWTVFIGDYDYRNRITCTGCSATLEDVN